MTALTQQALNDAHNAKANAEWGQWLSAYHWNLYLIPTFAEPVGEDYAQRAGELFVATMGPKVYAAMAVGRGEGGQTHLHLLLGGIWHRKAREHRDAAIAQVTRLWRHGIVQKVEPYDHTRKASRYLPDHHVITLVGTPRRHYD